MRPRAAAGPVADRAVPRAHPVLLHRGPRRREAARRLQRRQRVLGVRLPALRQLVARRARAPRGAVRRPRRRRRSTAITHGNAMRALPVRPVRAPAAERARSAALRAEAADVDTVTHVGRPADEPDLDAWRNHHRRRREGRCRRQVARRCNRCHVRGCSGDRAAARPYRSPTSRTCPSASPTWSIGSRSTATSSAGSRSSTSAWRVRRSRR